MLGGADSVAAAFAAAGIARTSQPRAERGAKIIERAFARAAVSTERSPRESRQEDRRNSLRITSFNPDQVSSIAHTFTSTNPIGSATSRTTSSVTSVSTLADLFGQETQTVPV